MFRRIWGPYGTCLKKRKKRQSRIQDMRFLDRSYEWLKWKAVEGPFVFHVPCS